MTDKDVQKYESSDMMPAIGTTAGMKAIQTAIEQGYGADALTVLERMLDLQMRNEANEARKAYAKDMAACQADMPVVFESRDNTHTKSKYAAYKDLAKASKPVYTSHGFSVSFCEDNTDKEGCIRMKAHVLHESGHSEDFWCDIPIDDKGPSGTKNKTLTHGVKSASSYGRGMLLAQIFNIPTSDDVDDDGNEAGAGEKISEEQAKKIKKLIKDVGGNESTFNTYYKISCVENLPVSKFDAAIKAIERKRK